MEKLKFDQEESFLLENYILAYGIRGSMFRKPFTRGGDQAAEMEAVRARMMEPLETLREGLQTAQNADESLGVLFGLLSETGAYEKMLAQAKEKLQNQNIRFLNVPSDRLEFSNEFDVVTAIQSHHYFDEAGRELAVKNCYRALKDGGAFITFENIRMDTDESDAIALKRWIRYLEEHGNSPEDVRMHIERRGVEVFPITIEKHIELLKKAGFSSVNVLWASYLQAGFWAIKT